MEYLKPKFSVISGGIPGPRREGDIIEECDVCGAHVSVDSKDPTWRPGHADGRDHRLTVRRICFWRAA